MAPNYSKSAIYKLVCNDPLIIEIYIGSSTNTKQREKNHKRNCNNEKNKKHYNLRVYTFIRANGGWSNWKLVIIEDNFPCENASQMRAKERYHYDLLKPQLNMVRPLQTKQERKDEKVINHQENREERSKNQKLYQKENRVEIARQKAIYDKENRVEIARKRAIYRKENREELLKKQREKYHKNKNNTIITL
jgi:hypothetical protein